MKKKIDMLIYENTDKKGVYWVAFTEIALDAFKLWIQSVALASGQEIKFTTEKKVINFRRKYRSK
jgi:hypothetical protein